MSLRHPLLLLLVAGSLAGAGWQASQIDPSGLALTACAQNIDPSLVEKSFADPLAAIEQGNRGEALLALRKRADKGPHSGAARYLIGELTFEEGAYGAAVGHYRNAVETDPTLADQHGPFGAKEQILTRLDELKAGPWAGKRTAELGDVHFLMRRLAGGCE